MSVNVEERGSARIVQWDRQARRNAWSRETIEAIADAIAAAGADEAVRCVVVRGAGGHFSAGDDLHDALAADAAAWTATVEAFQRVTQVTLDAPVPVLAAIDGVCIGGALEFAASCDARIATPAARFATPEPRIGLTATNAGTLLLPAVLGETQARALLFDGRLRDAQWALRHGFVLELADDLDAAIDGWIASLEGTSRQAVAAHKAMLNARFGALLDEAMARETRWCIDLFDSPDARAALTDFAARRRKD